jgi:hypothetical protein
MSYTFSISDSDDIKVIAWQHAASRDFSHNDSEEPEELQRLEFTITQEKLTSDHSVIVEQQQPEKFKDDVAVMEEWSSLLSQQSNTAAITQPPLAIKSSDANMAIDLSYQQPLVLLVFVLATSMVILPFVCVVIDVLFLLIF